MKLNLIKKSDFLICVLLMLGGIGGTLFGDYPNISIILIILGALGILFSFLASEARNQELNSNLEAYDTLLAQQGIGNRYIQVFKNELFKTGSVKNGLKLLEKALEVDPNDMDALSLMSSSISLNLSLQQWLGVKADSPYFKNTFSQAKILAKRGTKLYPKKHTFLDALGMLSDLEGKHKEARQYFIKSGKLRKDPYWRLLLATSWHMSGEHQKAILELKKAESEKAQGWWFNLYMGRALNSVGNYIEARNYLALAFKERGFRPELIDELSKSCFFGGELFTAAKYILKLSIRVIYPHWVRGFYYFLQAVFYIGLGLAHFISKVAWKVTRHIPFVRDLHSKNFSPNEPEFMFGLLLLEKGNYKGAEQKFRSCCEITPTEAASHANLALCLAAQGLKDEALIECDKSIELNPKNELLKCTKQQIESGHMYRIVDHKGKVFGTLN